MRSQTYYEVNYLSTPHSYRMCYHTGVEFYFGYESRMRWISSEDLQAKISLENVNIVALLSCSSFHLLFK